ncbi:MAG: rod shape-determining protein RodA [Acidobacteria bacterium]|nr:MAG: rod shape-determining protein RodA [Acidobacteriota bacterium]
MSVTRILSRFDLLLFAGSMALAFLGILGVYSASLQSPASSAFSRQLIWTALGLFICFIVFSIDYHHLVDYAFHLYVLSIGLLVGILLFGKTINGSKSWLTIGGQNFQPSEVVKVIVILALTRYLSNLSEDYLKRQHFIALVVIAMIPVCLVVLQGDLGTALMYFPILGGMMLIGGLKFRFVAAVMALGLAMAPAGWLVLEDYQKQRILVTFDPDLDPKGYGYQTRQSQIAIGSGGLLGTGLGNGLQSQLGFVPEIHTDFIFALLAEETGLLGACLVLMLYLFVLSRMIRIGEQARDRSGILIITGIASLIFFHVVINVGMALGITPAIGIPLPLLSYGGSSALSTYAALGLALNVHYHRFVY